MACRVLLTRPAMQDRRAIVSYLADSLASPTAAAKFLDEFDAQIRRISSNPCCFPLSADQALASKGYRKALVLGYVFVYVYDDKEDVATVLRVFHQSQDYARYL